MALFEPCHFVRHRVCPDLARPIAPQPSNWVMRALNATLI